MQIILRYGRNIILTYYADYFKIWTKINYYLTRPATDSILEYSHILGQIAARPESEYLAYNYIVNT
jgi:hypothetical protein